MKFDHLFIGSLLLLMPLLISCNSHKWVPEELSKTQVHRNILHDIRLGDGVPLQLDVTWQWSISQPKPFAKAYEHPDSFSHSILVPAAIEIANLVSHNYKSVDSVFAAQRKLYIEDLRANLSTQLGEPSILIHKIIVSAIDFPPLYATAKEEIGLKAQELEFIREQSRIDLSQAEADRKRTEAQGKIQITQAESDGRLQKIQAETEQDRRAIELARAETQAQVDRLKTNSAIEEKRLLAKAELDKLRDLKNLEIEKRKDIDMLALETQRKIADLEHETQIKLAELCTSNPVYASFLVNKELAGKVEIAVLPTGTDPSVFGNLINQSMPAITR